MNTPRFAFARRCLASLLIAAVTVVGSLGVSSVASASEHGAYSARHEHGRRSAHRHHHHRHHGARRGFGPNHRGVGRVAPPASRELPPR